jgi:Domain of unknown function (DUF5597)/Glycosyl hydrolases family 35
VIGKTFLGSSILGRIFNSIQAFNKECCRPNAKRIRLALALVLLPAVVASAVEMPKVIQKDGRYALLMDGKPYLILGAQINNSSSWADSLPEVWPTIKAMHANTIEAPVYWEQMEPQPGKFDFSTVDLLINQSRSNNVHLVLLWFGTWKNGKMHYVPAWVKTETAHYPRMVDPRGEPIDVLSPNSEQNLDADKRAFTALVQHVKEVDASQHTVLMIQVENESGSLGTVRDYSPMAEKQFNTAVPADFVKAMHKQSGTWKQVFGADADETFAAYSVAHYIDQIVAAGKEVYPLPMYCNVWLGTHDPGSSYPSGGAVPHMIDIWKATAHNIDMIGPDIYIDDSTLYRQVLAAYQRPDNAMWVPESGLDDRYASYFFYALGKGAIGFSPFGIDETGWTLAKGEFPKLHSENYILIEPMNREIAAWNFEGKLKTAVEEKGQPVSTLDFGKWQATVTFGLPQYGEAKSEGTKDISGRALVVQISESEFLLAGFSARVVFKPQPADPHVHMEILSAEEGQYQDGTWKMSRMLNGDQTDFGLNFAKGKYKVVRVTLGTY